MLTFRSARVFKTVPKCVLSRNFADQSNDDKPNKSKHNLERFLRSSQGLRAFNHDECPENPTIVLFPGQGSQFVGMAKSLVDIPEAVDMFDIASSILK